MTSNIIRTLPAPICISCWFGMLRPFGYDVLFFLSLNMPRCVNVCVHARFACLSLLESFCCLLIGKAVHKCSESCLNWTVK